MAVLRLKDGEIFVDLTAISGTDGADAELPIHYTDKQVLTTDWVASTEYAGFGYQADISCPTTSAAMYADLALAHSEAITGNYSPVADTLDGYVRIFAKEVPAEDITIPYIRVVNVSDGAPTGVFLSPLAEPASDNSLLYGHEAYTADGTKLTGAGAYYNNTILCSFTGSLPETFTCYTPIGSSKFRNTTDLKYLTLYGGAAQELNSKFYNCSGLKSIHFAGDFSTSSTVDWRSSFYLGESITEITGNPFDLTSTNQTFINSNSFGNGGLSGIETISFVPSTIKVNLQFSSPALSTASLLSIANGLDAASPATLTMHATSKTNMDAIIVDNNAGVAELGGTMSLSAFITGVKGWTIA